MRLVDLTIAVKSSYLIKMQKSEASATVWTLTRLLNLLKPLITYAALMSKIILFLTAILCVCFACQQEKYTQGKRIYKALCSNCHMDDGKGLGQIYPSIQKSVYLHGKMDELTCLIRTGKQSSHLSTVVMPAFDHLREAEMSNLINYLSHEWGDKTNLPITSIREQIKTCPE